MSRNAVLNHTIVVDRGVAARRTHAAANRPSCVSLQSANHGCFSPSLQLIFEFPGQRDVWEVCSMGSDSTHRGDSMVRGDVASSTSLRGERAERGLRILTPCGDDESILFFFFFLDFTAFLGFLA